MWGTMTSLRVAMCGALLCMVYVPCLAEQPLKESGLVVVTVSTNPRDDGLQRFLRSARVYNYTVEVVGVGQITDTTKLEFLKAAVVVLANEDPDRLVLYTESQDVVLAEDSRRVVEEFERSGASVLVSADGFCWPDRTLEANYPPVERGRRFLNSGGFVGRAGMLKRLLKEAVSPSNASLQHLLTHAFIKEASRIKYNLKIDHKSNIFQNLNGATGDVELRFAGKEAYLQNTLYNTVPVVVRGNGHTSLTLNTLGSYIAKSWNPEEGCRSCWDEMLTLNLTLGEDTIPKVTLAIFIENPTPFLHEFFEKLEAQVYPKSRVDIFLHNSAESHDELVTAWLLSVTPEYASVHHVTHQENVKEWHARNMALDHCLAKDCQYILSVDSEGHLDNPFAIKLLVEQNREVVAPMLSRPYKAWSNFWGAITSDGFYARSMDYMELVQNQRRGLWNVPYITTSYMLRRSLLDDPERRPSFIFNILDADMALCENLRKKGIFMYVSNRVDFGHLVNTENYDSTKKYPELWQILDNRFDFERRYIHENYSQALVENSTILQPCPDVYWFPVFKERFCAEMIESFEDSGQWSDGSSTDPRLEGGYESVPTIDIHMKQMGMHEHYLEFLRVYVQPLQLRVYDGYHSEAGAPHAIMNFMVRYKPEEQPLLRPHHDTSTYTINVALNKPGIDYKGGGCRFVRYNCSVTDTKVGWMLMHPGRLTHLHEGLRTTKGTRYIIVSFVDP